MSYMVWDSTFDVGVPVIDSQHRRIVDYINQLHRATEGRDKAAVVDVLEQLVEYTVAHFGFEEAMQEQGGYPHREAHKKSHESFARKIHGYQERCESGEDVADKLLEELRQWLINHIQKEDADFAPYLKNNVGRNGVAAMLAKFFK